ncbi:MAG: Aldehyde:ferredoxin oxidoreductase [Dehalococcoidia bacterium]|nr:Aldehyde:ferredoxin oxidoreductase [Dehalococcoidia bacterium]
MVYLYIGDSGPELRDAWHLAGKDTWDLEDAIKAELGYKEHMMSVFGIGPAGENLVRFAGFIGDRGHAASHNGTGAVLGVKRLKAIAVGRGKKRVRVHDTKALTQIANESFENMRKDPAWNNTYLWGMMGGPAGDGGRASNTALVNNYTSNILAIPEEKAEKFHGPYIREHFQPKAHPCWACQMHHCNLITITEGPYTGFVGEEPEAEGISAFGSLIGNDDGASMVLLCNEVDRLGFCINEAGWVTAFAMEMYEKGLFNLEDTDGLELNWGNVEAVRSLLRNIANRKGLGELLADGVKRASERLGGPAPEMAVYTMKGASPRSHDHRVRWLELFDTCVSDTSTIEGDASDRGDMFGIENIKDGFSGEQVTAFIAGSRGGFQVTDSLGICKFPNRTQPVMLTRMLNAATGWDFTWDEAMEVGLRAVNIMRMYNLRCKLVGPQIEQPGPRYSSTPTDGAAKGKSIRPMWPEMLRNYYTLMGWNPATGAPKPETLRRLGLEDLIPALG